MWDIVAEAVVVFWHLIPHYKFILGMKYKKKNPPGKRRGGEKGGDNTPKAASNALKLF